MYSATLAVSGSTPLLRMSSRMGSTMVAESTRKSSVEMWANLELQNSSEKLDTAWGSVKWQNEIMREGTGSRVGDGMGHKGGTTQGARDDFVGTGWVMNPEILVHVPLLPHANVPLCHESETTCIRETRKRASLTTLIRCTLRTYLQFSAATYAIKIGHMKYNILDGAGDNSQSPWRRREQEGEKRSGGGLPGSPAPPAQYVLEFFPGRNRLTGTTTWTSIGSLT